MLKEKINAGQDTTNLQDNLAAIENRVAMLESQRDVDLMFFNYTNLGIYSITIKSIVYLSNLFAVTHRHTKK